jgi:hypothetical protein
MGKMIRVETVKTIRKPNPIASALRRGIQPGDTLIFATAHSGAQFFIRVYLRRPGRPGIINITGLIRDAYGLQVHPIGLTENICEVIGYLALNTTCQDFRLAG